MSTIPNAPTTTAEDTSRSCSCPVIVVARSRLYAPPHGSENDSGRPGGPGGILGKTKPGTTIHRVALSRESWRNPTRAVGSDLRPLPRNLPLNAPVRMNILHNHCIESTTRKSPIATEQRTNATTSQNRWRFFAQSSATTPSAFKFSVDIEAAETRAAPSTR